MLHSSRNKVSSRNQIKIKEVKDGVLVLPGNKYRVIIETSSVNFELKSDSEQDMIIENFQNFLNSLPCPIQILIRIRELDIDKYLEDFEARNNHEKDKLYASLIKDYGTFVKGLVKGNKVLSRRFYIVIGHEPKSSKDFSLVKEQLKLNRDIIVKGLERLGMKTTNLNSVEILELFYSYYNPNLQKLQSLRNETISALESN
jgi:hypothetical protein